MGHRFQRFLSWSRGPIVIKNLRRLKYGDCISKSQAHFRAQQQIPLISKPPISLLIWFWGIEPASILCWQATRSNFGQLLKKDLLEGCNPAPRTKKQVSLGDLRVPPYWDLLHGLRGTIILEELNHSNFSSLHYSTQAAKSENEGIS